MSQGDDKTPPQTAGADPGPRDTVTPPAPPEASRKDAAPGVATSPQGAIIGTTAAEAGRTDVAPGLASPEAENDTVVTEAAASDSEPTTGPKVVRRVVCSYKLGWLPGDWLQTWRRLDRVFSRAELNVKATLAPLEDLPEDTDILVVPPDLREAAYAVARPGMPILVTPAGAAAGAFADLVSRLKAGTEFTAEKVDPDLKDKPKIVSYRGHTLLD